MITPETVVWGGYGFTVYDPAGTTWNEVPGLYVFAGRGPDLRWYAKYIGRTTSFSGRLPNHDRWNEAVREGATHVHARVVHDEFQRKMIESVLIQTYQPPLNSRGR